MCQVHKEIRVAVFPKEVDFSAATTPNSSVPSVFAANEEVMTLIERHRLGGKGLGWIDAHLLASALLGGVPLWTRDRSFAAVAKTLGIAGSK